MRTIASLASQTGQDRLRNTKNSFALIFIRILAIVAIGFAASSARADSWTSNFTITGIFVAGQNNYQYRVMACQRQPNALAYLGGM
jgi:hypothetical protein